MKKIELIDRRCYREKHFLREDGTFEVETYINNIHYKKDNKFEEINNSLVKSKDGYYNVANDFKVFFNQNPEKYLTKIEKDNHYIELKLLGIQKTELEKKIQNTNTKLIDSIIYKNIKKDIDIKYEVISSRVKETIILNSKDVNIKSLEFSINTDLDLINKNGIITAKSNKLIIFSFNLPYMVDSIGNINTNLKYVLSKEEDRYDLSLKLDYDWLKSQNIVYPVYIDPTIQCDSTTGILDTYIYPGDTANKGGYPYISAGVERISGVDRVNRGLIKFNLPILGTSDEIINASLNLTQTLPNNDDVTPQITEIHRVTSDWTENNATWSNMNNKYDTRVEAINFSNRTVLGSGGEVPGISLNECDITNLVKAWYQDVENYGVMLKNPSEIYFDENFPQFFSSEFTLPFEYSPRLLITYRNHNGLERYLNYKEQEFSIGKTYANTCNGNLTGVFSIGNTIGGKYPVNVCLIYNTHDVVLNNSSVFGKGFKLSLDETIQELSEYTIKYYDSDGTVHYFLRDENSNIFIDEEGLDFKLQKISNNYVLFDGENNRKIYVQNGNVYYLMQLFDSLNNQISITRNSDNNITKIVDANANEINITYSSNQIVFACPQATYTLTLNNNKISQIISTDGPISISYNTNELISAITNIDGIKMNYYYYDKSPYKIMMIKQYGLNNEQGQQINFEYGCNVTRITDHDNSVNTLIFNDAGNMISSSNMSGNEDINEAYSITQEYGNSVDKNKIVSSVIPLKYVKNHLENTSFEVPDTNFTKSPNAYKSISSDFAHSGENSLLASTAYFNEYIEQLVNVPKGKYYTFSGYFISDSEMSIELSYTDSNNNQVTETQNLLSNIDFYRDEVTIYYPTDAITDLKIKINMLSPGVNFIDDIQLEEGECASNYNIIENSDFSNGIIDWTFMLNNQIVDVTHDDSIFKLCRFNNNQNTALRVHMLSNNITSFSKEYNLSGTEGDLYHLSFWYKNEGIVCDDNITGNNVSIFFLSQDEQEPRCALFSPSFSPNENMWQHFSYDFIADDDYDSIELLFHQGRCANDMYITNLYLYKDVSKVNYEYDSSGNVISIKDSTNRESNLLYNDENELIKITTPRGSELNYEYDNIKKNRCINAISSSGISNKIKYDNNGNPIIVRIGNTHSNSISTGIYKIRCKGTDEYFKIENNVLISQCDNCSNPIWNVEVNDNLAKIKYTLLNLYIAYMDNNLIISNSDNNNLFELVENDNKSYCLKIENTDLYLKCDNGLLSLSEINDEHYKYEFYFETVTSKFIENSAEYDQSGRFVSNITDTLFNKTEYTRNAIDGTITKIKSSNDVETNYSYDNKNRFASINKLNKTILYTYDDTTNLLSKITQGSKEYNFTYDNFLNLKKVMLGNSITFMTTTYNSNNGKLNSITYGNGNINSYDYDEFKRIRTIYKQGNNNYNYRYDSNGNLSKIFNDDYFIKNVFDINGRICDYRFNNLRISYKYDSNDNIINKKYYLDGTVYNVDKNYNLDDNLTSVEIDNELMSYVYDDLGRLVSKQICNDYVINYGYESVGKRTSLLVNEITNDDNKYKYKYDSLNNITHIYYNDNLIKRYYYDSYNQLIKEEDFNSEEKIEYSYDLYGNLLLEVKTDMALNTIIYSKQYTYSNSNWVDQLTNIDNQTITYDSIGNAISYGNNVTMTWENGKELKTYSDTSKSLNVSFKYNADGVRISKTVNNVDTNYYLENKKIIFEKTGNNYIYYFYDHTGVAGFIYNNSKYYYLKNLQGDIIGILDNMLNQIVFYEYDSWGKVLSVKDENGDEITNPNNVGLINPFRFRGYYYDSETKLYYLISRYYNPEWKRFISTDDILGSNEDIFAYNLYLYVSNNPITLTDFNGNYIINPITPKMIINFASKLLSKVKKIFTIPNKLNDKNLNTTTKQLKSKYTTSNTENLPDYTDTLNKILISNTSALNTVKKSTNGASTFAFFYEQVDHGGNWDYKKGKVWENEISEEYLGLNGKFLFNGLVIDAEIFGNLHYGFVGSSIDLPPQVLFFGGGYAKVGMSLKLLNENWGDNANDHQSVSLGIDMYNNWCEYTDCNN